MYVFCSVVALSSPVYHVGDTVVMRLMVRTKVRGLSVCSTVHRYVQCVCVCVCVRACVRVCVRAHEVEFCCNVRSVPCFLSVLQGRNSSSSKVSVDSGKWERAPVSKV